MYPILYNNMPVGFAEIAKEGLYYRFSCKCKLPGSAVYRVIVSNENAIRNLGVCVPDKEGFVLKTRVPKKYFTGKNFLFSIDCKTEEKQEKAIPVFTGMAFAYLDQLEAAQLKIVNGQPSVVINPTPTQQDNDQNQGLQNK